MESMEPCKATRPDEGTSSDETVRSNEGARSDERTPSDEGTCSDESAAHADAGSMEATATPKAAAEAAHASIRGRRRRHCTNECNGRSENHDLTPHDLSSCPFSRDLVAKSLLYKNEHWGADVQRNKNFSKSVSDLSQFLTRKSVLCGLRVSSGLRRSVDSWRQSSSHLI
jgi:hypothetical protein